MSASKATAANRFGLGARPGELERGGDGREVLLAQLRRPPALDAFAGLAGSVETLRLEFRQQQLNRAERAQRGEVRPRGRPANGADAAAGDPAMAATAGAPPDGDAETRPHRRARAVANANVAPADSTAPTAPNPRDDDPSDALRRDLRRQQLAEFAARYRHAAGTDAPFVERLTQFWSNHFAVSIDKGNARLYAGSMEREAIRPHVLGRFQDMLTAVESHPAMLRYLDNAASIGDDSRAAQRARRLGREKRGLNENLAREILELHTLGVDGGYRQDDVIELARAITGWSTPGPRDDDASQSFAFRANAHEPGARRVLGRDYAEGGLEQGRAVLADLARHPATARHLSFKLARHFVADQPPPALVERMAQAYLREDGDLRALYRALIDSEHAWSAEARKFKTPNDFVISALRAGELPVDGDRARALVGLLASLGQPVFTPRSPAGFPDTAADWSSPDGLFKRIQAAQMFAARVDPAGTTPYQRALDVLGRQAVSGDFAIGLRRAGSASDGYSLLFASPAFQWRV